MINVQKLSSGIKAVIFDYGCVLTIPQPEIYLNKIADLLGTSTEKIKKAYYEFRNLYDTGNIDGTIYWNKITQSLSLPVPSSIVLNELIDLDIKSWAHQNQDMWRLVSSLKPYYKTALLSNNVHEFVEKMEKELALVSFFDTVVFSNRLHILKPDPAMYNHCLEQLKVKPSEAIFIDDKIENINGAEALGMKGVLFTSYKDLIEKLTLICLLSG